MKCPKCQNEINDNAKFCNKCGCNIVVETANIASRAIAKAMPAKCAKCGAELETGAKFCVKCGALIESDESEEKTVLLYGTGMESSNFSPTYVNNTVHQGKKTKKEKQKKVKPAKQPKVKATQEKTGAGFIISAVVLGMLVLVAAVVCVLVWKGNLALPGNSEAGGFGGKKVTEAEDINGAEIVEIDEDELFAEADELLNTGKNEITDDAEVLSGMNNLRTAMEQFAQKAEEAGDISLAEERIDDAYASYVTAVNKHKDMLNGQTLSGSIYGQVMIEINDAIAFGEELNKKGYEVDMSGLTAAKEEFDAAYTAKMVTAFNEFCSRENWSRTESWNLMSGADGNMFEASDLDDPIRLRYAYALSWWIQKQIETEINGTITTKGAAIKIGNLIETMDYNPMMIKYYIDYMKAAGENCEEVERAYNDVIDHIYQTQGIKVGTDIPLDHFWYFNDFGTYSVDSVNGVTQENRQWIRNRMSTVTFVTQ